MRDECFAFQTFRLGTWADENGSQMLNKLVKRRCKRVRGYAERNGKSGGGSVGLVVNDFGFEHAFEMLSCTIQGREGSHGFLAAGRKRAEQLGCLTCLYSRIGRSMCTPSSKSHGGKSKSLTY